jgi:hypothetical protein
VSEDNIELKNHDSEHDATERGSESTARDSSGELSGGRRDRSREMLREELERNLDDATRRSGGKRDWEPPDRSARAAREATADKPKAKDGEAETAGAATTAGGQVDTSVAPKSWRADERAHYDQLPPEIKHAIHRREQESERGVAELKNRYAELDAALAPSMEVIKSHGHTAGTAVRRMFDWWNALANRPDQSFPALMQAMNYSPQRLAQVLGIGGAQQQQPNPDQQQAQQWLQAQIDARVGAHVAPLQQHFQSAQEARTQEILAQWSEDKPHYARVRQRMSTLLQPNQYGVSVIPLTPEGHVDLDGAYRAAVAMDPELSGQMVAEQVKAKLKAESERAQRARYTSSSLRPASPGSGSSTAPKKRSGAKSVRDSINEAMLEIRDA